MGLSLDRATFPLLEIEVHPGHCYLRAKHGHEQSEGKHVKG